MHILISGEKHIGKSTLIDKIINKLDFEILGFRTYPYYNEEKCLRGFYLKDYTLELNERDYIIGYYNGYKWVSCPEVFDKYTDIVLSNYLKEDTNNKIIVFDELGFFENEAYIFQKKIFEFLNQKKVPILAAIKNKNIEFLNKVKKHYNTKLYDINENNRDAIIDIILTNFL